MLRCLGEELKGDPDELFLLLSVQNGFYITDKGSVFEPSECEKYKSASEQYKERAEQQVYIELDCARYVVADTKPTISISLGAILKPGGKAVSLIPVCSSPIGHNITSYATVDSF